MIEPSPKQFATVREVLSEIRNSYGFDGGVCPACGTDTLYCNDRRYCSNDRCNALILAPMSKEDIESKNDERRL